MFGAQYKEQMLYQQNTKYNNEDDINGETHRRYFGGEDVRMVFG